MEGAQNSGGAQNSEGRYKIWGGRTVAQSIKKLKTTNFQKFYFHFSS